MLNEIVFTGRHFNVLMIVTTQDAKGLPPNFHQNADMVAMTYSTQKRQLQIIEENYAGLFKHQNVDFYDLILENTQDHGFVIVNRTEAKYKLNELFFHSKADLNPKPFKIGSDKFWEESNSNWERQLEVYKVQKKKEEMEPKDWLKVAEKQYEKEKLEKPKLDNLYLKAKEEDLEEEKNLKPDRSTIEQEIDNSLTVALDDNENDGEYQKILNWVENQIPQRGKKK